MDLEQLKFDVDAYLLSKKTWVKARELCAVFSINERVLRAIDDQPGICSRIAISGNKGYKHVSLATRKEWTEFYARERKHNVMALVNLRNRKRLRERLLKQIKMPPFLIEKDSKQGLLAL